MSDRAVTLAALRARLDALNWARRTGCRAPLAFGVTAIDAALPGGGLARGGVHEIIGEDDDAARFGFVAALLGRLPAADGRVLWCRAGRSAAAAGRPYGPGLAAFGLAPERLILFEGRDSAEVLWAMEEGLRCRRLAAVIGEGVTPSGTALRRLHLAAEAGDTVGILLLSPGVRPPPGVALTRWRIAAVPGEPDAGGVGRARWRLTLLRCRGGRGRGSDRGEWTVEWDDEALCFALVADLGDRPVAAAS